MTRQPDAARALRALHKDGFILPNAWDIATAKILAAERFPAIATTSAGVAFSLGKPDYQVSDPRLGVTRDQMLARAGQIAAALDVPVSADLEAGYGDTPETVAETIRLAVEAGLAGGNIEDLRPGTRSLYEEALAVERIAAARAAAGPDFVLNARTDVFQLAGSDGLAEAVRRANRFIAAGADCVFTPGPADVETVSILAREIDGPVNVVLGLGPGADARALIAAGARRITVGGSIARAALGFVRQCAHELREHGTVSYASSQIPQGELNALFEGEASPRAA